MVKQIKVDKPIGVVWKYNPNEVNIRKEFLDYKSKNFGPGWPRPKYKKEGVRGGRTWVNCFVYYLDFGDFWVEYIEGGVLPKDLYDNWENYIKQMGGQ